MHKQSMFDREIVELEDKLNSATFLLRFFKAYLLSIPNRKIKVSDKCVQMVTGDEYIEVLRSEETCDTYIKLSSEQINN